ncbi:MAG TPA: PadR family transcriptional regulator [Devosia sp.]|nr:PadR family transcriptional regulator [Devosia sp.]
MNVRTLCLAILHDGESTGYQIRKLSTEGEYSYFVDASYGSIYPALARLENEGMVTSRVEQQEGRPAKKVYSITPKGREEFHESLFNELDRDIYRSEFLLFARFAPLLPVELVEKRINEQIDKLNRELEQIRELERQSMPPHEKWVLDYGTSCLAHSIEQIRQGRQKLLDVAIPSTDRPEAAE